MFSKETKSKIWMSFFILLVFMISFVIIKTIFLNPTSICNDFNKDFKSTCLQLNAQKLAVNDFDRAWKICKQINQDSLRDECYNDIIVGIGKENLEEAQQHCEKINSEKWRGECYFNMALFLTKTDIVKAFAMCNKAEIFIPFCYHDVAGEASLINATKVVNICEKQTDNLIKRTCFHGIGKYLGRTNPEKAIIYCNKITEKEYKESCYHGMGWGISEINGSDKAIFYCRELKSDLIGNCLVGVAWQVSNKRPPIAENICRKIINKKLEDNCLSFISKNENN